jgi:hypothetical protein
MAPARMSPMFALTIDRGWHRRRIAEPLRETRPLSGGTLDNIRPAIMPHCRLRL